MNDYYILDNENEEEIKKIFIGRKVKVIKNDKQKALLKLDNGIELEVQANEGCGGCGNGWYSIENINNVDNAITNVELVCDKLEQYGEYSYKIFVFCEDTRINLLQVDGDDGNGYYGTGYEIIIKINIINLLDLYNKEKEKNNKLTSLIYKLRNELRKLLISYDGEYYRPIKNTKKQEVYESYFKVRAMLKGEYCFKDNETAIKELLEEE